MFSYIKTMSFISLLAMSFVIMSCNDTTMTDIPAENEIETLGIDNQQNQLGEIDSILDAIVSGRTIGGIELPLADLGVLGDLGDQVFTGRITNLRLIEGDEPGQVLASGRLIGRLNGERINDTFEDVLLQVLQGDLLNGPGTCPILYLELGPIFLNVLGLIVEVPETVVVEIRAERGPGNLLGNLLCGLLGILD